MAFTLGRDIHACIDGEVPIFFDLVWDRYFRLADDGEAAFRRLAKHEPLCAGDDAVLADLVARGVLSIDGDQGEMLTPAPPLAAESADRARPSARFVGGILIARIRMRLSRRHIRTKLLGLASFKPHATAGRGDDRDNTNAAGLARTMVASLGVSDLIMGQSERCLERALAVVHLLRRAGAPADLVLGVTSRPFAAHCWVQQGAVLLGDRAERVRTFTPIAVL